MSLRSFVCYVCRTDETLLGVLREMEPGSRITITRGGDEGRPDPWYVHRYEPAGCDRVGVGEAT